jgi:2-dehydropantoate 2-reductase
MVVFPPRRTPEFAELQFEELDAGGALWSLIGPQR